MDWWKDRIQKLNKIAPKQWLHRSEQAQPELPEEVQDNAAVKSLQRRVRLQAMTALVSILVLLVLVFAITAAWYTNVAKTSDLMFQTEAWGFDEDKITLSGDAIAVAPGSSGVVPIEVDNGDSTAAVKIGVSVNKNVVAASALAEDESGDAADTTIDTTEELRKRIFFYADTARTYTFAAADEGEEPITETVSRVYLGKTDAESYTYEILPGGKLTLTESYYNDVPIKWMWTYDMLGYYFRGAVDNSTVLVDEYIRPIQYDYAYAVFDETVLTEGETVTYGADYGQLLSTGEQSREDLLQAVSSADGYEGTINTAAAVRHKAENETMAHIYYPVEVDENGVGVWAYLCNKSEIEAGIAFDNSLGTAQEAATLVAGIVFTAVNIPANEQPVSDVTALKAALADEMVDVVSLQSGVYLNEPIALTAESAKVIDLNGYDLSGSADTAELFSVSDGASLTVMNGSLTTQNAAATAFSTSGAQLVLSDVTASGFSRIVDNSESGETEAVPSSIRVTGCDFESSNVALMICGSGTNAVDTTSLVIEDSRIASNYIAVSGNGTFAGTEIVIVNSELEGTYAALYQPQQRSTAIVQDSVMTGYTGIVVKGGTATIINSKITGTGAYQEAAAAYSGFIDTGDGIYVEAVYDWSATVIVKGAETTITSTNAYAVELYGMEDKGPGKIMLYEGTLLYGENAKGAVSWNGIGTFEDHTQEGT